MTMQNLAIVFGPTLFGQPAPSADPSSSIADAPHQNQVGNIASCIIYIIDLLNVVHQAIETILNHYTDIFVDESG